MAAERVDLKAVLGSYNTEIATSLETMAAERVQSEPVPEDYNTETIPTMETTMSERVITVTPLETVEEEIVAQSSITDSRRGRTLHREDRAPGARHREEGAGEPQDLKVTRERNRTTQVPENYSKAAKGPRKPENYKTTREPVDYKGTKQTRESEEYHRDGRTWKRLQGRLQDKPRTWKKL